MGYTWDVFVEGPSDKVFLQCLLKNMEISRVHTSVIGGGVSHLHKVKNEIQRSHDNGKWIAIVLDADCHPQSRRIEFLNERDKLNLTITDNHCFLLPNNHDQGDLETLLEQISVREHRTLHDCFEEYERCMQTRNELRSYHIPNNKVRKAKIYAYGDALGIETNENKRDYCDSRYWDLNASAVEPLKQFLSSLPR